MRRVLLLWIIGVLLGGFSPASASLEVEDVVVACIVVVVTLIVVVSSTGVVVGVPWIVGSQLERINIAIINRPKRKARPFFRLR